MGIFSRKREPVVARRPTLGEGRHLRTTLPVDRAVEAFGTALSRLREPQYPEMPFLHVPGWTWLGPAAERPRTARVGYQQDKEFLFATFSEDGAGTSVGLFPLSMGDEQFLVSAWKQLDSSLSSMGRLPAGLISLDSPPVDPGIVAEMLAKEGRPASSHNLAVVGDMFTRQIVLKLYQFLESEDPRAARAFADRHQPRSDGSVDVAQKALEEFAAMMPRALPYMQDITMRIRAIMLQSHEGQGTFWDDVHR